MSDRLTWPEPQPGDIVVGDDGALFKVPTPRAEGLREALFLLNAVDSGFGGFAIRIPNPGQRRAIVRAADNLRAALAASDTAPGDELRDNDGTITEGSLTPGGNRVGPKAWRLIVALMEYDDWAGAVLDVIDEAALAAPDTAPGLDGRLRTAVQGLIDALPYEPGSALGGKIALVIAALASPDPTEPKP